MSFFSDTVRVPSKREKYSDVKYKNFIGLELPKYTGPMFRGSLSLSEALGIALIEI